MISWSWLSKMGFFLSLLEKFAEYLLRNKDAVDEALKPRGAWKMPSRPKREDEDAPNLFIGKIIDDGTIKCEVVDVHNTNMHVKILEINWPALGTYLDLGKVYPVYMHRSSFQREQMQMWEISPKRMKRDTSQVLLMWEKGIGWSWDLDS
jgi:hypothetical protein